MQFEIFVLAALVYLYETCNIHIYIYYCGGCNAFVTWKSHISHLTSLLPTIYDIQFWWMILNFTLLCCLLHGSKISVGIVNNKCCTNNCPTLANSCVRIPVHTHPSPYPQLWWLTWLLDMLLHRLVELPGTHIHIKSAKGVGILKNIVYRSSVTM